MHDKKALQKNRSKEVKITRFLNHISQIKNMKKLSISKGSTITHHIHDKPSKFAIIHDDMEFIDFIKDNFLSKVKTLKNKRYPMHKGFYKNAEITLVCTNMGAGNTAAVTDEIIDAGIKYIIKIGTFGALDGKLKIGEIMLPNGAVRTDGTTDAYALMEFPAVPDMELLDEIKEQADRLKIRYSYGIIWSANVYQPITKEFSPDSRFKFDTWRSVKVKGVEWECSSLFIPSLVKGAKAAAILICNRDWKTIDDFRKGKKVVWNRHKFEKQMEDAKKSAAKLALETFAAIKHKA